MQVIILRGVPGVGKSTHAEAMGLPGAIVVSADQFFTVDGVYRFDPKKLSEAHNDCLRRYLKALTGTVPVIVDNTNTSAFEFAPYYRLAEVHGWEVRLITLKCDPIVAHARNVHGVPLATVQAMAARLEAEVIPPWWTHEILEVS